MYLPLRALQPTEPRRPSPQGIQSAVLLLLKTAMNWSQGEEKGHDWTETAQNSQRRHPTYLGLTPKWRPAHWARGPMRTVLQMDSVWPWQARVWASTAHFGPSWSLLDHVPGISWPKALPSDLGSRGFTPGRYLGIGVDWAGNQRFLGNRAENQETQNGIGFLRKELWRCSIRIV